MKIHARKSSEAHGNRCSDDWLYQQLVGDLNMN
jgi:hypothetical protein